MGLGDDYHNRIVVPTASVAMGSPVLLVFLFHRHEERVKHVVIETKPDPVIGVLYHITSQGPFFNSVTELIEEAKKSCIIQNHMFDVILTKSPPKVTTSTVSFVNCCIA